MQPNCPSRFKLDQFLHEECTTEDHQTIQAHLEECPLCRGYLTKAKEKEASLDEALNPKQFAARIESKWSEKDISASFWAPLFSKRYLPLVGLMTMLILSFALFFTHSKEDHLQSYNDNTIKGSVSAKIFCKRSEQIFELEKSDPIKTNDALRFEVYNNHFPFFFLLSIQADGLISAYIPFSGQKASL